MSVKVYLDIAKNKRYEIFTRPYELNIWGIRSKNTKAGKFDDRIVCFWQDEGRLWHIRKYIATTDPGTYYLENPMPAAQELGTAILKQGQYLNTWQGGFNSRFGFRAYELVQIKPVTILRDYDRNAILDFFNGKETTGLYGINIHVGTTPGNRSEEVGKWSAGCQVFADWQEFQEFTQLCLRHAERYGNIFSYTLIDKRAENRAKLRRSLYVVLFLAFLAALWFFRKEVKAFYKNGKF